MAARLMLRSVNRRGGEIGRRRAVSARPRDIRLQFLLDTAVTAVGGVLRAAIGAGLALYAAGRLNLGGSVSPAAVVFGLALAAATGLVAGVIPAPCRAVGAGARPAMKPRPAPGIATPRRSACGASRS